MLISTFPNTLKSKDVFVNMNTVKMNMLYPIKKNFGNRLQAILFIKFNKLELSNN